jgi:hypothetical protein
MFIGFLPEPYFLYWSMSYPGRSRLRKLVSRHFFQGIGQCLNAPVDYGLETTGA